MKYPLIILIATLVISGCSTPVENDPHVLKSDRTWNHIIDDPYDWARQQITEAGPIGNDGGLCSTEADINDDGQPELFIHADVPSSLFVILVFEKVDGGYKYLGSIDSNPNMITFPQNNQIVTYQRCGGHNGSIVTYALKQNRFEVLHSSGLLSVGDGGDDKHNERLSNLGKNCNLVWKRMPNKTFEFTSQ